MKRLSLFVALILSPVAAPGQVLDGIGAVINGEAVPWSTILWESAVLDAYAQAPRATPFLPYVEGWSVRDAHINRALFLQRYGLAAPEGEARVEQAARVREFRSVFSSDRALADFLRTQGRTIDDVEQLMGQFAAIDGELRTLASSIRVRDEDVEALFRKRYSKNEMTLEQVGGRLRAELLAQRFEQLIRTQIASQRNGADLLLPSPPWGPSWQEPQVPEMRSAGASDPNAVPVER